MKVKALPKRLWGDAFDVGGDAINDNCKTVMFLITQQDAQ